MANSADQLLRDGDLDGARAALVDTVRGNPSDVAARMFLFQLLAVAGEWDKAKNQLATLATLSAEAQMLAAAYGPGDRRRKGARRGLGGQAGDDPARVVALGRTARSGDQPFQTRAGPTRATPRAMPRSRRRPTPPERSTASHSTGSRTRTAGSGRRSRRSSAADTGWWPST